MAWCNLLALRVSSWLAFLLFISLVSALKFDIVAHPGHESKKYERCIRNFVVKDQLVVVTAIIDGAKGDGQELNIHVSRRTGALLTKCLC
jgi:p24 family protein delta-1